MHPLFEASWAPGLPSPAPDRRRALAVIWRGMAAAAALGGLPGCGGGGGSDEPSPAPSPVPPPPGPLAAQLSVPAPVGYDAERLAAFDRLNEIRRSAGLGLLAQDRMLDEAAQAHAAWIVANDSFTHDEGAGTPGFTGERWWNRAEAAGYVPIEGDELMSAPGHGAEGVDALVNTVYHRAALLVFEPVDVGIGWSGGTAPHVSLPLVMTITRPGSDAVRGRGQAARSAINGVAVWPVDGATGVPLRLGGEIPNPVPPRDVASLGTPASVSVDAESALTVDSFVLADVATGVELPARILVSATDPNVLLPRSFAALVPLGALTAGTTYRAEFTGSVVGTLSGQRSPIRRSWVFRTAVG